MRRAVRQDARWEGRAEFRAAPEPRESIRGPGAARARASWENSPENAPDSTATGLGRGSDIAVRLRRGHGLSAPAEDEGAAAALLYTPVNLRPEGDKVINARHQRHTHHEPDRRVGNPVDGEN